MTVSGKIFGTKLKSPKLKAVCGGGGGGGEGGC